MNRYLINEGNQSTICMALNPKFHGRVKHIDIRQRYIRQQISYKEIAMRCDTSEDIIADILTKGLSGTQFNKLQGMIGIYELSYSE